MNTIVKEFLFDLRLFFKRPKENQSKIFCVGYNKTGTTSCGKAFEILGYDNLTFNKKIWRKHYKKKNYSMLLKIASKFDSFDDLPWLKEDMIPLLDKAFFGSKYIYLERDEESWKKSFYNWRFKEKGEYPNVEGELTKFRNHREFIFNYFKNRPDDFLVINIAHGDSFMKIADFLGKKATFQKMPHENKT